MTSTFLQELASCSQGSGGVQRLQTWKSSLSLCVHCLVVVTWLLPLTVSDLVSAPYPQLEKGQSLVGANTLHEARHRTSCSVETWSAEREEKIKPGHGVTEVRNLAQRKVCCCCLPVASCSEGN